MPSSLLKELQYCFKVVVRTRSGDVNGHFFIPRPLTHGPLISCVMPTHGRLSPARFAIECFQKQTYLDRELVIVCKDSASEVEQYVAQLADPRISFAVAAGAQTVGDLRNHAITLSRGDLICVWDDDDLSAPDRLSSQTSLLQAADCQASFLLREMVWSPRDGRLAVTQERLFQENTMLVRRDVLPPYPSVPRGGDTMLVEQLQATADLVGLDDPAAYIYVYHGGNIWSSAHFEEIFAYASATFSGEAYVRILNQLAASVPIQEYEEALRLSHDR